MELSGKDINIFVDKDANEAIFYAATELKKYLKRIFNAEVSIVNSSDKACYYHIILGVNELSKNAGLTSGLTSLGDDGYILRTINNQLFIIGNKRGVLYGVYSFLEDYLGCRFFTPSIEIIPKKETTILTDIEKTVVPFMEYREPYITELKDPKFAAKMKVNGQGVDLEDKHGGKITYAKDYFVHTFTRLFPIEEYFEEHPEYYALIDGVRQKEKTQLCLTNENVLELTIKKVKEVIKENPDATIISISQDDNYNGCTCENCRKIDEHEESQAGSLIHFVNAIAKALEEEYPHIIIDTLAYQYTRKPPKYVKPHKQVCVRLCTIECCFTHPLSDCHVDDPDAPKTDFAGEFAEDLINWGKICQRLYIWDYVTNFSHYWMPHPNFSVLSKNIKFFADNNVKGVFEQGCPAKGGGEMTDLRGYILSRCLWDNKYDENKAMDEFLSGVYGVAGYSIKKYLDTVYNYVEKNNCHLYCFNHPDKPWHTMELVLKCEDIFKEALTLAENEEIYKRIEKQKLAVDYLRILLTPKKSKERDELLYVFEEKAKEFGLTHLWEREDIEFCLAVLKGEKDAGFWWAN